MIMTYLSRLLVRCLRILSHLTSHFVDINAVLSLISGMADTLNIARVFTAMAQTEHYPFPNDMFSFDPVEEATEETPANNNSNNNSNSSSNNNNNDDSAGISASLADNGSTDSEVAFAAANPVTDNEQQQKKA